jgi:hypothetical protein
MNIDIDRQVVKVIQDRWQNSPFEEPPGKLPPDTEEESRQDQEGSEPSS